MKINSELLKGSTSMIILHLLSKEDMYGYQMIKRLTELSDNVFQFKEGTLYPILHSLEESNHIDSYWDESASKKRKYYSITNSGKKVLLEKHAEWKLFSKSINNVIGGVLFAY